VGREVASLPSRPSPLVMIQGPTQIGVNPLSVCWRVVVSRRGGRAFSFSVSTLNSNLAPFLETEEDEERVCIYKENWAFFSPGSYTFDVEVLSHLFQTRGKASLTFFYASSPPTFSRSNKHPAFPPPFPPSPPSLPSLPSPPSPPRVGRQLMAGCPSLWDSEATSIYGIESYPSGLVYLPSSVREVSFTITVKALTGCDSIDSQREILSQGDLSWELVGVGVDANDFSSGTQLTIPSSLLSSRSAFPVGEPVGVVAKLVLEGDVTFEASLALLFLPGPVEIVINPDPGYTLSSSSPLLLDLTDSTTVDGVKVGSGLWEWLWRCTNLLTEEECVYKDGRKVVMPGSSSSVFESDGAFEEEIPLLFVVNVKVDLENGLQSEGRLVRLFSTVNHHASQRDQYWHRCET